MCRCSRLLCSLWLWLCRLGVTADVGGPAPIPKDRGARGLQQSENDEWETGWSGGGGGHVCEASAPSQASSSLLVSSVRVAKIANLKPFTWNVRPRRPGGISREGEGDRPWARNGNHSVLACDSPAFAPGFGRCGAECPFLLEDESHGCFWRCVSAAGCPATDVRDRDWMMCRRCDVSGCARCAPQRDVCEECVSGFVLSGEGCTAKYTYIWHFFFAIAGLVVGVLLLWYIHLLCRPRVNPEGLQAALDHRWRSTLHDVDDVNGDAWYALSSDLRAIPPGGGPPIGGPGLMLLFQFQFAVLLWIIMAATGWWMMSLWLGTDLLLLGTIHINGQQEMCQAVRWGRAVRDQLRDAKLAYMGTLYVLSTLGALALAVLQYRRMQMVDSRSSTMADYALACHGFPHEAGPTVEADIQAFLAEASGCQPVGVSVAWDFGTQPEEVINLVRRDVRQREENLKRTESAGNTPRSPHEQRPEQEGESHFLTQRGRIMEMFGYTLIFTKWLDDALAKVIGADLEGQDLKAEDSEVVRQMLAELRSAGTAVAVFASEALRDTAMQALATRNAPLYKGSHRISARKHTAEPQSLLWENFSVTPGMMVRRFCIGVFAMLFAILSWGLLFYAPYAYYETVHLTSLGEAPPLSAELTFSLLVVMGNQIMYLICDVIAQRVGFRTWGETQACYVALYTFAIIVNTVVDLGVVMFTAYASMASAGVRTAEGTLLSELPSAEGVFLSYPMMKAFGQKLYEYNFPSCFLLPFVMEVFFVVLLPYHLGCRIVASRKIAPHKAEHCVAPVPMDVGRYGDLLANLILCTTAFFTASGWVLKTLLGLLAGNLFIYAFDHYRILRHVENFYLSSGSVDALAQQLLALPCGVLAAALAAQYHGYSEVGTEAHNGGLWQRCALALGGHVALHLVLVRTVLPVLGKLSHDKTDVLYETAAGLTAPSFFNTNPVHCLRSIHMHRQDPPCIFYVKGKEHVLERNKQIGLHYGRVRTGTPTPRRWSIISNTQQSFLL